MKKSKITISALAIFFAVTSCTMKAQHPQHHSLLYEGNTTWDTGYVFDGDPFRLSGYYDISWNSGTSLMDGHMQIYVMFRRTKLERWNNLVYRVTEYTVVDDTREIYFLESEDENGAYKAEVFNDGDETWLKIYYVDMAFHFAGKSL
jgi:hypothetical protein